MKATYLLVDALTLLPTLLFSFHPRIAFYRQYRTFLPALVLTAALFLVWDARFTHLGVWGFNPRYLTGWRLGNLPVEEWLFFICIPYSCLFTAYCRRITLIRKPGSPAQRLRAKHLPTQRVITTLLIAILLCLAVINPHRRYTTATFLSLSILLAYCCYIRKVDWLGRFYLSWLLLLPALLLVDGILTGTGLQQPVVWYAPNDILGPRVLTIPVEDFFYGMELILVNALLFDAFRSTRLRRGSTIPGQIL